MAFSPSVLSLLACATESVCWAQLMELGSRSALILAYACGQPCALPLRVSVCVCEQDRRPTMRALWGSDCPLRRLRRWRRPLMDSGLNSLAVASSWSDGLATAGSGMRGQRPGEQERICRKIVEQLPSRLGNRSADVTPACVARIWRGLVVVCRLFACCLLCLSCVSICTLSSATSRARESLFLYLSVSLHPSFPLTETLLTITLRQSSRPTDQRRIISYARTHK